MLTLVALASCAAPAPPPAPPQSPVREEPRPAPPPAPADGPTTLDHCDAPGDPSANGTAQLPRPPLPPGSYYAIFKEPCGRSLLEISDGRGHTELVQTVGEQSPIRRLRLHALIDGKFIVEGRRTGHVHDDHHCGAYPELEVTSFRPWGPVHRMFSAGALNGELHFYTEQLPADRFAPEDFEGGPAPRFLDADRCTCRGACPAGWVRQTNGDGTRLYCPFL